MDADRSERGEAWLAPAYFAVYLTYLFIHRESELEHWLGLVLVPAALVFAVRRGSVAGILASFGLRRGRLSCGLGVTLVLGVAVGLLQVFLSRSGDAFIEAVRSGRAVWLFPLAFVLLLFLTGFTEEFFFRGFLQSRLATLARSRWVGWIVASLLFGLYHVPYAYFNPHWPSAGDWSAAFGTAMVEGTLGGLVLGGLFLWTRGNLVACIVLHALIDTFPAMGMLRFGSG